MAREPQLAAISRRLVDGLIDTMGFFREIGPYIGLTLVVSGAEAYLFSDPVTYEVFKASDSWFKEVSKKGMPFILIGQTGIQVVGALSKLAGAPDGALPEEIKISVDVTHTSGIHISGLKTELFINLQQCLDLEKSLLSDHQTPRDLAHVLTIHEHLHVPTLQKSGEEVLAYFKLVTGEQVLPIFSAPDLAFGALGATKLGICDLQGKSLFDLLQRYPEIREQSVGILFNPYTNAERMISWKSFESVINLASEISQSA